MKMTLNADGKEVARVVMSSTAEDHPGPPTAVGQLANNKLELKKLKYKIFGSIILGLGCITGAVILTYIGLYHWKPTPNMVQMYHVVLHDKSQPDSIRLDVTVDPTQNVEYVRSPIEGVGAKSKEMLGLKDFNKGIVAYKEDDGDRCLVTKLVRLSALKTFANGSFQEADVSRNETYMFLNDTIHPFVLKLAAGDKVVAFCGDLPAIWMIPQSDFGDDAQQDSASEESQTHSRKRRWGWRYRGYGYRRCWWNCSWWGWRKYCSRRCY